MDTEQWLEVGRIVAAQGVRGELRVLPLTDFAQRLTRPGVRRLSAPPLERTVQLLAGRALPGKDLFVCQLAGVTDRSAAEALVGATLWAVAERPPLAEGEFWLPDLMGARVVREDTLEAIGAIEDIRHLGNDLLVIALSAGGTVLVPFVPELVPEVDLAAGRVVVRPIPGLLDPERAETDREPP